MTRLFVALRPPPQMRAALLATMYGIAGARWQVDAQLHLTLSFVGEVDDVRADITADALNHVQAAPVELSLSGVGAFARNGVPHALWAGVRPVEGVTALAAKVRHALRRSGVVPERGAFIPHITVARLNQSSGPIDGWLTANAPLTSEVTRFDRFGLYESVLRPEGSEYHLLAEYGLS
jgi:RNA 2',3'-cyclic 3'-phosphodiesterase